MIVLGIILYLILGIVFTAFYFCVESLEPDDFIFLFVLFWPVVCLMWVSEFGVKKLIELFQKVRSKNESKA